jgi:hypothetical protein
VKIVLGRKGFDAGSGGGPSPILPGGRLLPLPIPDPASPVRFGDLACEGEPLGPVVASLTRGTVGPLARAHLDPDLEACSKPRRNGFRAALGQCGAAARHLEREGVGSGDLFLFFGWFREVERARGRWVYRRGAKDLHVIFGWLQVARVIPAADARAGNLAEHPHRFGERKEPNRLYLAARSLDALGGALRKRGAGLFRTAAAARVLTAPGATRSEWQLPAWFRPRGARAPLSYHHDPGRYRAEGEGVRLRSVARGQEFVLDTTHYPEAIAWARSLCVD